MIVSKWDPDAGDFIDNDATKKEEKKAIGPENQSRIAFTFKKLTMARSRHSKIESLSSEVKIESEPLQRLLGKITSKWGWSETVTTCTSPFGPLVYAWTEALSEAQKFVEHEPEDEKQARADLNELLRMISTSSGYLPLDRYFQDRNTFTSERSITHAALWTLFPPGTLIVSQQPLDRLQIFTVSSCDGFVMEGQTFDLVCFCFDWDGSEFGRVPFEFKVPYWGPDRRSIVELPFYPLQYYTEPTSEEGILPGDAIASLKDKLIKRGKKFVDYCTAVKGKQMFKYKGDAHFHTSRSLIHRSDSTEIDQNRNSDDASTVNVIGGSRSRNEPRYISRKKVCTSTLLSR